MLKILKKIDHGKRQLVLLALLSAAYALCSVAGAFALGRLTGALSALHTERLMELCLAAALAFAMQIAAEYTYSLCRDRFLAAGQRGLQMRCASALNDAPTSWLQAHGSGDLLGRLQNELALAARGVCRTLPDLFHNTCCILVCTAAMWRIHSGLAMAYLAAVAVMLVLQAALSRPVGRAAEDVQALRGRANAAAREILGQREVIKAYRARDLVVGRYARHLLPWRRAQVRQEAVGAPVRGLGLVCGLLPTIILCAAGAALVLEHRLALGDFMQIYFMADILLNSCMHYVDLLISCRKSGAAAQRVLEILEAPAEPEGADMESACGDVDFEHVWFRYPGSSAWALQDVTFHIRPGEKVALVGPSGCGKSTVLRLIEGLAEPQQGTIRLGGTSAQQLGARQRREGLSVVPQKPFLFADTVRGNILFDQMPPEERRKAAYAGSGVDAFLDRLPKGEQTPVGEGGMELSLGQSQRIAVARGLAKPAGLLLLDEATSALDADGDARVRESVLGLSGVTVLAVTHRLTGLDGFDRILCMDGGTVAEQGTHAELVALDGIYARLWARREEARSDEA